MLDLMRVTHRGRTGPLAFSAVHGAVDGVGYRVDTS